jgi:type 1 glutamine amidotransferase
MGWFGAALSVLVFGVAAISGAVEPPPRWTIAMLIAGQSYNTERTLPAFADRFLTAEFRVVIVSGAMTNSLHRFDNFDQITSADVLLVSVWRRTPPKEQLDVIRRHVMNGKPVIGIATASHAFARRNGTPLADTQADWPEWDVTVIGGNYIGHRRAGLVTMATAPNPNHPILAGVSLPIHSKMELNQFGRLKPGAQVVLHGTVEGFPPEPVAWTFIRADGGRTFFTALGHPEDFENPSFQRMLLNGIHWAATPGTTSNISAPQ